MPPSFPRTTDIPVQSPLFWVAHKDRYLRQLLISDIEQQTGRKLIVYFTDCDRTQASIDISDDAHLAELLSTVTGSPVDLMLETNGGATDTTEKICSMLRQAAPDLRVIVPRRAKSNGTVIALCGTHIMMGTESELGPIDPSIANIPVEFLLNAPPGSFTPIDVQAAEAFRKQTKKLAKSLLSSGMMKDMQAAEIEETVEKLATRDHYHSHGSVIDCKEAIQLKLSVIEHAADEDLWKKIWLLRTMYQYDCGARQYAKVFEGVKISSAVATAK